MSAPLHATVVVPTFNQREALQLTLESFAYQTGVAGVWDLILVDDGSDDGTRPMVEAYSPPYPLTYVRQANRGRAAARNAGLGRARGDVVIFCDSDRAVGNQFIQAHLRWHQRREHVVVIGDVREFYFSDLGAKRQSLAADFANDLLSFQRIARQPVYAKVIYRMFGADGATPYAMPWIGFFSGNASVSATHLHALGGFDEKFTGWGFEHFELGYRLQQAGLHFVYEPAARNYHFAHRRSQGFYEQSLAASFAYFRSKHPGQAVGLLDDFLHGRLSLQAYHNAVAQETGLPQLADEAPIYYRQLQT